MCAQVGKAGIWLFPLPTCLRNFAMHLYLQCPTGISGDMFLAAMADLGLDLQPLAGLFTEVGISVRIESTTASCCGLQGTRVEIFSPEPCSPLRTLKDIQPLIQSSGFSSQVKASADQAFSRLAQVEARVHGVDLFDVHFHEVGAVDTLVDILGCFWALERMKIENVTCSPLPWFQGQVQCEHGILPLPAPATAQLMQGKPFVPTSFEQELITPTGALLVDQIVSRFGPAPEGVLRASGTGWGHMDLSPAPNGLRVFGFSQEDKGAEEIERIFVLESNVDHLTGEEIGGLYEPLLAAGALDIIYLPGVMKKNRSGGLLQVLCRQKELFKVQSCFVDQTMTLGFRRTELDRVVLPRQRENRTTPVGSVDCKASTWQGEQWSRPEFEALQRLAQKTGRSVVQLRYMLQGLSGGDDT
jgi:hypothetical protein